MSPRLEINAVDERLARLVAAEVLGEERERALAGAGRRARVVRRDDHVLERPEGTFLRERLGREHVERGASDPFRLQRLHHRRLVDEFPPGAIYDPSGLLSTGEELLRD